MTDPYVAVQAAIAERIGRTRLDETAAWLEQDEVKRLIAVGGRIELMALACELAEIQAGMRLPVGGA